MQRGEIREVRLPPGLEGQDPRSRLAVIVSNDGSNEAAGRHERGTVVVVPVTTNVELELPFHVPLAPEDTGLDRDAKAQVEQLRSVSVHRIGRLAGTVPSSRMADIDTALRLHLAL
jgi:mRNA interferase MazF